MPQPLLESKKERKDVSKTKAPNKDMTQKTTIKKKYKIFSRKSIFFICGRRLPATCLCLECRPIPFVVRFADVPALPVDKNPSFESNEKYFALRAFAPLNPVTFFAICYAWLLIAT
jgi:hypothetical protein